MTRMKGGRRTRATSGYAYVGGACVRNTYLKKISSVALVEDSGGYSGVVVTAHEIGHLLGAVHDGDTSPSYLRGPGAKSCPWTAGYIMSDLRHTSRGQLWSDCSVKQIKYFLSTRTAQCLYNVPRSHEYTLPGDKILPAISLDDQCRKDRGTRACYHDHRVCAQLFCYTSNYSGCYAFRPAVEGSSCGHNKICINGKCVTDRQSHSQHQDKNSIKHTSTSRKPKFAGQLNKHSKQATKTTRKNKKKSPTTKQRNGQKTSKYLPRKSKSQKDPECSDSFALLGSLRCDQLFKRYSFHYCGRSKTVRTKCCKSYNEYCSS